MRLSTLFGVLFLQKAAVVDAFNSHWSLPVGGLLVLSAGIARNYDGEDLLAKPQWLAAPFAASILTSLALWALFIVWAKVPGPTLWRLYPRFLGLYWLTAPLAWLYAIPYERFHSPADAVRYNAVTLAVVSVWRVLIISAALSSLFAIRLRATLALTVFFGAVVMLVATYFGPEPVLDLMGGLRLPPEVKVQTDMILNTACFSILAVVIAGPLAAMWVPRNPQPQQPPTAADPSAGEPPSASPSRGRGALCFALACVLAWIPALLAAQPEQRNRRQAQALYASGKIDELIRELSIHTRADYPPNWFPPGAGPLDWRRGFRLDTILPSLSKESVPWVFETYLYAARHFVASRRRWSDPSEHWADTLLNPDYGRFELDRQNPTTLAVLAWLLQNDPTVTDDHRAALTPAAPAEPPAPQPESTG
ncbi:MAG TPA: hypothetical protein VFF65_09390 [Phycisphaerales bacterium]|nr:hypothetical protein [Phycisphaerales bacterium]